mgnify:CR=1 FL=1
MKIKVERTIGRYIGLDTEPVVVLPDGNSLHERDTINALLFRWRLWHRRIAPRLRRDCSGRNYRT